MITIDGLGASGKSTLCKRLSSEFGIPKAKVYRDIDWYPFLGQKNGASDYTQRIVHVLNDLSATKLSQDQYIGWLRQKGTVLIDEFWNPVIHFMAADRLSIDSYYMFDFLLWLLRLDRHDNIEGFEPVLSIYLKMSLDDHNVRSSRKFMEAHNLNAEKMPGVKESTKEIDEAYENAIGLMKLKLPYFHVIDARQPEDDVFNQVKELVDSQEYV